MEIEFIMTITQLVIIALPSLVSIVLKLNAKILKCVEQTTINYYFGNVNICHRCNHTS